MTNHALTDSRPFEVRSWHGVIAVQHRPTDDGRTLGDTDDNMLVGSVPVPLYVMLPAGSPDGVAGPLMVGKATRLYISDGLVHATGSITLPPALAEDWSDRLRAEGLPTSLDINAAVQVNDTGAWEPFTGWLVRAVYLYANGQTPPWPECRAELLLFPHGEWCEHCGLEVTGSHYHCAKCGGVSSMMGHAHCPPAVSNG